jgi:FixJ family two-component response regulator
MDVATGVTDGRPRVLIVENDPAVRRSTQLLLQGRGFDVKAYATGEHLLVEAARQPPDCFIADYLLDGADGIEVLQGLHRQGWDGPAVLISAFASPELTQRAVAAGFTLVFEKPLRERALVESIVRLTHHQGRGG